VPNPTTSKSFDLHQHERASPVDVAEGRRLLAEVTSLPWRTAATDDTCVVDADNEEVCALAGNYCSHDEWPQMEARAALIVFAVNNLPALLRAASERDAAVKEAERLREAAKLDYAAYVKAYYEHKAAGNDAAKDRCGARILTLERIFPEFENGVVVDPAALASAAPGGANG